MIKVGVQPVQQGHGKLTVGIPGQVQIVRILPLLPLVQKGIDEVVVVGRFDGPVELVAFFEMFRNVSEFPNATDTIEQRQSNIHKNPSNVHKMRKGEQTEGLPAAAPVQLDQRSDVGDVGGGQAVETGHRLQPQEVVDVVGVDAEHVPFAVEWHTEDGGKTCKTCGTTCVVVVHFPSIFLARIPLVVGALFLFLFLFFLLFLFLLLRRRPSIVVRLMGPLGQVQQLYPRHDRVPDSGIPVGKRFKGDGAIAARVACGKDHVTHLGGVVQQHAFQRRRVVAAVAAVQEEVLESG